MGRVLVADDEAEILGVMLDVLEAAGHEVTGVKDGEEAVTAIRSHEFDVALLDVVMPKLDGYHVATHLHGLPNRPKICIVTSRNFDGDKRAVQASGVDAFLPKPFSNKDLLEVVATLIAQRQA